MTINAAAHTSAADSTFAYNDREGLKQALLAGLGLTKQDDGSLALQIPEPATATLSSANPGRACGLHCAERNLPHLSGLFQICR